MATAKRKWTTLKSAGVPGSVRYREHETRTVKKGAVSMPDRYYQIRYSRGNKQHVDAMGWWSHGITEKECFETLLRLYKNYKSGQGPTTLEEERLLLKAKEEKEEQEREVAQRNTFAAFFYDIYYPNAKTRVKKSSYTKTEIHVRLWIDPVTKNTPFDQIGLAHAEKIRNNLVKAGKSARTQEYVFTSMGAIWKAAQEYGLTDRICPTKLSSFKLPKVNNSSLRFLTSEEEEVIMAELEKRTPQGYRMAMVSLYSGMRFGEVAALRGHCIDIPLKKITVLNPKNQVDRVIPMPQKLVDLFTSIGQLEPQQLVFPNHKGEVYNEAAWPIRQAFKHSGLNDGLTERKVRATFHTFRHTYASRLVQLGQDLYRVQKLMGHSTIGQTAKYAKLNDVNLEETVQVLDGPQKESPPPKPTVIRRKGNGNVIPFKRKE